MKYRMHRFESLGHLFEVERDTGTGMISLLIDGVSCAEAKGSYLRSLRAFVMIDGKKRLVEVSKGISPKVNLFLDGECVAVSIGTGD